MRAPWLPPMTSRRNTGSASAWPAAAPSAPKPGRTGIAQHERLPPVQRRHRGGALEAQGHDPGATRDQAIGPAQHGVLLVDQEGRAAQKRRHRGRHRRIAAEGRGHGRPQPTKDQKALQRALHEAHDAAGPRQQAPARARRRDRPARGLALRVARAPGVGEQRHLRTPLAQRPHHRERWEHVAAGAAGGDDDRRAHSTTSSRAPRRVRARSMPMPRASAMVEEPP